MSLFSVFQIRLLFFLLCHHFFFRAKLISGSPNPYTICRSNFTCGRITSIPYPFWGGTRPDYCGHPDYKLTCSGNADPVIQIAGLSYRVISLHPDSHTLTIARTDLSENHCEPRFHDTSMDPKLFRTTPLDVNASLFYNCSSSISLFINSPLPHKFSCDPNCDGGGCLLVDFATTKHLLLPLLETICPVRMAVVVRKAALLGALHGASGAVVPAILRSGFEVEWTADVDRCSECVGSGGACGYSRTSNEGCCFHAGGRVYSKPDMSVAGTSPESSVVIASGWKRMAKQWVLRGSLIPPRK